MKKFNELLNAMEKINNISWPGDDCKGSIKRLYKTKAKSLLTEVAKDLGLNEFKCSFNPAGPAVTGDPSLYGMWNENEGIAIHPTFNVFGKGSHFMYRKIKSMKDYRGEQNRWIPDLSEISYEEVIHRLAEVRPKETLHTEPLANPSTNLLIESVKPLVVTEEKSQSNSYFAFFLFDEEVQMSQAG